MGSKLKAILFSLSCMFFLFSFNTQHNAMLYADDSLPFEGQEATADDENVDKQYGQDKDSAQDSLDSINGGSGSIVDMEGVNVFRSQALNLVHIIAGLMFGFAVIMVTAAGFKIAMSQGNDRTMSEAKTQIMFAGIGIGVALFVEVIVQLFQAILSIG